MRAGFMEKTGKIYYTQSREPMIERDTDVKIQVKAAGICGSEVHAFHGKHPFRIPPVVSGHEFAGVVVETGKAVTKYKPGDRVTAEPQYGCGKCKACLSGRYNICGAKEVLGAGEWSGSFGEFVVVPEKTVVPLGEELSFEQGALIEPLAVGMHAVRQHQVGLEDTVLIIGAGTIGLGVLLCAKACNPKCVITADVSDYNLQKAKEIGSDYAINSQKENLEERVREITGGNGADVTFLAFGNAAVAETAARCTKRGGVISEIAVMPNGVGAPYGWIQNKEITLAGSNMYVYEDFETVVDAIRRRLISTEGFVTQRYPIEEIDKAMEMADKRPEPVIKVMLEF